MTGRRLCFNRRDGVARAEHEAELARRQRQQSGYCQADGDKETKGSRAHAANLRRWLATVVAQASCLSGQRASCPLIASSSRFFGTLLEGFFGGTSFNASPARTPSWTRRSASLHLPFRLVEKFARFPVRWFG